MDVDDLREKYLNSLALEIGLYENFLDEHGQEEVNKGLSKMMDSLEWAAIRESPWQRFAPEEMDDQKLAEFAQDHSRGIAICMGDM